MASAAWVAVSTCHESSSWGGASFSTPHNVRLVDGGLGGAGAGQFWVLFFRFSPIGGVCWWISFALLWGILLGRAWGEITGAADAADARLLWCYCVHGLDLFGTFLALFSGFAGQDSGVR